MFGDGTSGLSLFAGRREEIAGGPSLESQPAAYIRSLELYKLNSGNATGLSVPVLRRAKQKAPVVP